MSECKFTLGPDIWYSCYDSVVTKQKVVSSVKKEQEEGSAFGWLLCATICSNYSRGFDYNWFEDKCTCKGEWMSPIWRR